MGIIALTETYNDVKGLIYSTVLRFVRCYGGDVQEFLSEANELFLKAYNTYESDKSSFTHWVAYIVFKGLLDIRKKQIKRAGFLGERVDLELICKEESNFNLEDFKEELTQDANIVVRLLLETDNTTKPKISKCLQGLGWSLARILESFSEISRVLLGGD